MKIHLLLGNEYKNKLIFQIQRLITFCVDWKHNEEEIKEKFFPFFLPFRSAILSLFGRSK